ncbi:MAG: heavy metal translocating P-type ATPase [Pseudomonadota bacterium]
MSVSACPGCAAGDVAALAAPEVVTHQLVLPGIHCAGCIRGVERVLADLPGIAGARVNLTRKRVAISADGRADPERWIEALARAGFEAHEVSDVESAPKAGEDFTVHMGVAGFAMMNVTLLSVAVWSGAIDTTRDFLHWTSAAIALPAAAFSAQPFFRSAARALKGRRVNMDVPISLAILLACAMSLYEVMHSGKHAWFDAALTLTFFLLVGRVLDQRLRRAAQSAADNLAAMEPARVLRLEDGLRVSRLLSEIRTGDRLWLTAGARVPVDAQLLEGPARIDASFITGESDPVTRSTGATLNAGEIILGGPVMVEATAVGEDTTLRRISRLVAIAEGARGRYTGIADRAAELYTPVVHILSAAAFLGWFIATGDLRAALNVAIATLIITCPCALGLAVPAVAVAATARLYRAGLLIKSETALERFADIDTVVFDKTGTLTERRLALPEGLSDAETRVLRALADSSAHPLCRGLRAGLEGVTPAPLSACVETAGQGVAARFGKTRVALGRASDANASTVFDFGNRRYPLEAVEALLPSARGAVDALHAAGVEVVMLTGDTRAHAERTAAALAIEDVRAGVGPEDKIAVVKELEQAGARVLMVGDGLNDTAALAAAHASMAPGSALDASRKAADAILVSQDLTTIATTLALSRTATRRMAQNINISTVYNVIAVPIAVAGFATPLAASIAMSASSITVVLNAVRGLRS